MGVAIGGYEQLMARGETQGRTCFASADWLKRKGSVPPLHARGGVWFGDYGRFLGTGFGGFSEGDF